MRWGISGKSIPPNLLYANVIQRACMMPDVDIPPCLAYAIACNESIIGEMNAKWKASSVISSDGGHGLFQLTSWWPKTWDDPNANAYYATKDWILPDAIRWFREYGFVGDTLVKATAASFNAGFSAVAKAHAEGDLDSATSDHYGTRALVIFDNLITKGTIE